MRAGAVGPHGISSPKPRRSPERENTLRELDSVGGSRTKAGSALGIGVAARRTDAAQTAADQSADTPAFAIGRQVIAGVKGQQLGPNPWG